MTDRVNSPLHYNTGKIEVIDFIEDQRLGFCLGNVVKYIARSAHKGSEIEDLEKARWYLDRQIGALKAVFCNHRQFRELHGVTICGICGKEP